MKIKIDTDELYPCYYLDSEEYKFGRKANARSSQIKRWKRIAAEFEKMQKELGKIYDKSDER